MPAAQEKVGGVRLAILEKWISQGAEWPNDVRLVRPQDIPARKTLIYSQVTIQNSIHSDLRIGAQSMLFEGV